MCRRFNPGPHHSFKKPQQQCWGFLFIRTENTFVRSDHIGAHTTALKSLNSNVGVFLFIRTENTFVRSDHIGAHTTALKSLNSNVGVFVFTGILKTRMAEILLNPSAGL
jgi:hypothetical protein